MKFDKILEYQRIDQELIALENEVAKSKAYKDYASAKARFDAAKASIIKLSQEAAEMLAGYAKLTGRADKLKESLDEFNGILDGVDDVGETDYYIKQIASISDEITALEKEIQRDNDRIDGINAEYKKTFDSGVKATDEYKKAYAAYNAFIQEMKPRVDAMQKALKDLRAGIEPAFMEAYDSLRTAKKFPAFVEYEVGSDVCGRCFMELSGDIKGKLKNPGDYAECPNCRRILFVPGK